MMADCLVRRRLPVVRLLLLALLKLIENRVIVTHLDLVAATVEFVFSAEQVGAFLMLPREATSGVEIRQRVATESKHTFVRLLL